ncbi:MAG: histidine kinase [Rhodobacter sp.]|nr:histidine kinase [Rhodobacter sp.]
MNGKLVAGGIVLTGLVAGIAMYWLQVHAFYSPVSFAPGAEITLVPIGGDVPRPIAVETAEGIDANSSPLRFRACFTTPLTQDSLRQTYRPYDRPTPLTAPGWFDCFDADAIGEALERGEALAFLSQANIARGVDRVVAVFPDGRAFAWHQLNDTYKE